MKSMAKLLAAGAVLSVLAIGLGAMPARTDAAAAVPRGLPPSSALLLRYDANQDGVITKEEMEAGLNADFELADANHDGCLDPTEMRAENDRRLKRDGGQAAPVVDWNLDGCVDPKEFGNAVRSYFDLVDATRDGKVTMVELRAPSMHIPAPVAEKKNAPTGASTDTSTPGSGPGGY